jgi:hypothetical protein
MGHAWEVDMPDWQGELESLLATLNVTLEGAPEGKTPLESAEVSTVANRDGLDDANDATSLEVVSMEGDEVRAVRSEIEATVAQVVALVRAGRMDPALRDDVIFVLDALTRPRPGGRSRRPSRPRGPDDSVSEWNLASAAAILRFCRIVLRLTNAIARDDV